MMQDSNTIMYERNKCIKTVANEDCTCSTPWYSSPRRALTRDSICLCYCHLQDQHQHTHETMQQKPSIVVDKA